MKVFEIQPSSNTVLYMVIPLCILLLAVMVLLVACYISSKRASFTINNGTLEISATLYGRKIPLSDIRKEDVARINPGEDAGLQTRWRTNGIGLPGYSEGWFRLKNGKKALLFVTDKNRSVLVPTKKDFVLILSPADPDEFIRAIRM